MMMLFVAFAALGGAVLPLQALINARLGGSMNGPVWAATISFAVGTIGLPGFLLLQRAPLPTLAQAGTVPGWAWLGGLLGAFYVAAATTTVPKAGCCGDDLSGRPGTDDGIPGARPFRRAVCRPADLRRPGRRAVMLLGGAMLIVWSR